MMFIPAEKNPSPNKPRCLLLQSCPPVNHYPAHHTHLFLLSRSAPQKFISISSSVRAVQKHIFHIYLVVTYFIYLFMNLKESAVLRWCCPLSLPSSQPSISFYKHSGTTSSCAENELSFSAKYSLSYRSFLTVAGGGAQWIILSETNSILPE